MSDLIRREDAIDAVENNSYGMGSRASVNAIKSLPSAEAVQGEWKPFDLTWGRNVYFCTACKESTEVPTVNGQPNYNYCPNCGAMMVREDGKK